jgi:hypothetical protein
VIKTHTGSSRGPRYSQDHRLYSRWAAARRTAPSTGKQEQRGVLGVHSPARPELAQQVIARYGNLAAVRCCCGIWVQRRWLSGDWSNACIAIIAASAAWFSDYDSWNRKSSCLGLRFLVSLCAFECLQSLEAATPSRVNLDSGCLAHAKSNAFRAELRS